MALILGGFHALGYAPYDLWYVSLFTLVGLFLIFSYIKSNKQLASIVFCFCLANNFVSLFWISKVLNNFGQMPMPLVIICLFAFGIYLALLPTFCTYFISRIFYKENTLKLLVGIPIFWIIAENINGFLFTGFPWNWLGYTQIDSELSNYAPIFGVLGVSYFTLLIASATALAIKKFNFLYLSFAIAIYAIGAWLSTIEYTDNEKPIKVALMQGNIPTETKWDPEQVIPTLENYMGLLNDNLDASLVVWPESAIPALENNLTGFISKLDEDLSDQSIGLITGVQYYNEKKNEFYNGIIGIGDISSNNKIHYEYGVSNRYYKHHLVPIGEFVPFESLLRTLGPIFNMPMSSFTRGNTHQPNILIKNLNIASAICYEIVFSDEMRNQIYYGTNMIITISNDGWFNYSNGPYQHLNIARMRAKEFSKPVLRATNNGITAVIDKKGNIQSQILQNIRATLRTEIAPSIGITPYANFGNTFLWLGFALLLLISIWNKIYRLLLITFSKIERNLFKKVSEILK